MAKEVKTKEELVRENADLKEEVEELKRQLAVLKRAAFGQKSEKRSVADNPDQLSLFNEAEKEQSVSEREEEKSIVVNGHSRKKKRTRDEIFKDLPVEEVIHKADTDVCPECQSPMQTIGKEYIHEELVYMPAKMFRRKHYVEVVKCPECGEYTEKSTNDKTVIVKGKAPATVLPKSYCSPELLAHIFYEKYAKAVPLERLSKDFRSMKAEISTPTLANWVIEASQRYLKPIYEQLHTELLKERVIHADETVVQVLHEQNRKAKTQSRMWVYCTDKIKLYQYTQTRNGENAETFLKGYTGYLVCDGYDGYNKLKNVTRCGCWAHARRKFYEALPADEEIRKISRANEGFERINRLFDLEREYAKLGSEERYTQRQEHSGKILDDFYAWLETVNPSQGTGLAKAVQYKHQIDKFLKYQPHEQLLNFS
ncbi:MAG: IS66 family transposase [Clostridiaceae bacterium]|nr:IS66 family transposase [Clostridiaceae bacterium]